MFTMSFTHSCQCRSTSCLNFNSQHTVAAPPTVRVHCAKLQNKIVYYFIGSVNVQNNSKEEIYFEMWHDKMELNSLLSMLHAQNSVP